jgi:hypothetical protein
VKTAPKRALARVGGAVLGLLALGNLLGLAKVLTGAEAQYVERLGGVGLALLLKLVMLAVTGGGAWYLFKYADRR